MSPASAVHGNKNLDNGDPCYHKEQKEPGCDLINKMRTTVFTDQIWPAQEDPARNVDHKKQQHQKQWDLAFSAHTHSHEFADEHIVKIWQKQDSGQRHIIPQDVRGSCLHTHQKRAQRPAEHSSQHTHETVDDPAALTSQKSQYHKCIEKN